MSDATKGREQLHAKLASAKTIAEAGTPAPWRSEDSYDYEQAGICVLADDGFTTIALAGFTGDNPAGGPVTAVADARKTAAAVNSFGPSLRFFEVYIAAREQDYAGMPDEESSEVMERHKDAMDTAVQEWAVSVEA